jgi:hypothetical protein
MGIFIAYEPETVTKKPDFCGEDSRSIYQRWESEIFPTDPLNTISRDLLCHTSGTGQERTEGKTGRRPFTAPGKAND